MISPFVICFECTVIVNLGHFAPGLVVAEIKDEVRTRRLYSIGTASVHFTTKHQYTAFQKKTTTTATFI